MVSQAFSRTQLLLGTQAMRILRESRVAVFGLGGVGSFAAEALARSGVGALDLIDHDQVSPTNINRQLVALNSTVGHSKAHIMAARVKDINPECSVTPHTCFYLPDTADQIDLTRFDYVVDAVDTVTAKLLLIQRTHELDVPLISCMGTANKLDPTALRVGDIYETSTCPLAKIIRKECRKRGIGQLEVVYSTEPAQPPSPEAQQAYRAQQEHEDATPDKFGRAGIPGSTAFVPPAAGLVLASRVVQHLIAAQH